MLKIIRSVCELHFPDLFQIYQESIIKTGKQLCRNGSVWDQIRDGEAELYASVTEFLSDEKSFLAIWAPDSTAVACLRMESYNDGLLLTCLETAPERRGEGAATELVKHVLAWLDVNDPSVVYSHVMKSNDASLVVHRKNGFQISTDYARLLDGSVSNRYYTLKR